MKEFDKIFHDNGNIRNILDAIRHYMYDLHDLLENGPFDENNKDDIKFIEDTRVQELEFNKLYHKIMDLAIKEGIIL